MSNNMKDRIPLYKLMSIFLLAVMVLTACATPTPAPAPTPDVAQVQTQAAQDTLNSLTAAAPTPAATIPPAPGPTVTVPIGNMVVPTPVSGQPEAIANYNTVIMSGPGTNYVVYGAFLGGARAVVVGKNAESTWWAVSVPAAPGGSGWVSAAWARTVGAENVPVLPTPPVPPTTELVPPEAGDPVAVVLVNAFVRTGPGENYPAYGIGQAGASARVIGISEDNQWWAVRLNPQVVGAGNGWVLASTVQVTGAENVPTIDTPPASDVEAPPPPAAGVPSATAVDFVNVRTGPSTAFPVIVVAPPGAAGEVVGKSSDNQWWQVKISTQFSATGLGWVSASFVTTANTSSVPVVAAPPTPVVPPTTPVPSRSCALLSQSPADYTVMAPDTSFTTNWTVKNTGTSAWTTDSYDVKYLGASSIPFHSGADGFDLPTNVEPGWTFSAAVSMIAPSNAGTFGEAWGIIQGSNTVCTFWVWITVQ